MTVIVSFFLSIYFTVVGRAFLGSGEEAARLRGGRCSAPGRKVLGSEEEDLSLQQAPECLQSLFPSDFQVE